MNYESLHNHTNISDGELSHLDLLAAAQRQGVGVVGLTDHDTLPGAETLEELQAYAGPVKWTVGIELSAGFPKEQADWKQHSLHLLAPFIDPTNSALIEFCAEITKGRLDRAERVVAHLSALGFAITLADCLAAAGPGQLGQLGQPHIVSALLREPANVALMARIKAEMKRAAEDDEDTKVAYDSMLKSGARQEPYTLFMGSKSFRPLAKKDFAFIVDLDAAVSLIRQAGGVALIAHPYVYFEDLLPAVIEKLVADGRIDGLETDCINTFGPADRWAHEISTTRAIAERTGCLALASCDAHDEADLAAFAASTVGRASIGQTARLIQRTHPDLAWSNLG